MKNHFRNVFYVLFFGFGSLFIAVSANSAEAPKVVTAYIETWLETNARDAGSSNNQSTVGQTWFFDFALPENYVFEVLTEGTKSIEGGGYDSSMSDSYLQLEKGLYKSDFLNFLLSARYIAPTSETSRDFTHLNWGLQIRPTFIFTLYKEGDVALKLRTRPTYNEFFYSQDHDNGGLYNIQRTFTLANRLHLDMTSWMYAQLYANYTTKWNTNGDHVDDSWLSEQCLGFTLGANYYLEFYHSSGNKFYSDDGQRNSIDAFDNKHSTYRVVLGFTF